MVCGMATQKRRHSALHRDDNGKDQRSQRYKEEEGTSAMTEDEKVEQQRKAKATKDRKKQKEKERTARARPAANFFNPHGSQQPPTATTWEVDSNNNSVDSDDVLIGQVDGAANEEEHDGEEQKNDDEDEQNQSDDEVVIIDSASPRFVTPKDVGGKYLKSHNWRISAVTSVIAKNHNTMLRFQVYEQARMSHLQFSHMPCYIINWCTKRDSDHPA